MKSLLSLIALLLVCIPVAAQPETPTKVEELLRQATEFRLKGDLEAAIAAYDKALTLKPQDAIIFELRGVLQPKRNKLDDAL